MGILWEMKFNVAQYTSLKNRQNSLVNILEKQFAEFFQNKDYGDIKGIIIGFISTKPEFDEFMMPGPTRMETIDDEKYFTFDIKVDYSEFTPLEGSKFLKLLSDTLCDGMLSMLAKLKKRDESFKVDTFRNDIEILRNKLVF